MIKYKDVGKLMEGKDPLDTDGKDPPKKDNSTSHPQPRSAQPQIMRTMRTPLKKRSQYGKDGRH
jgi:hypothetical protein